MSGGTKSYSVGHFPFQASSLHRAFGPVDLCFHEGECVAVVGRSGAGKSTLARCLAGLERLSTGALFWGMDAKDVTQRGPGASVQLLFQDSPTAMNPAWSASAILTEPLLLNGISPSKQRIAGLMAQVGLSQELLTRRPAQLSGGQRRRLSIARALALPSLRVLILDEPFAGLDERGAEAIAHLLSNLRREKRLATLLITHDLAGACRLADRLVVMDQGRIVEELPAQNFRQAAVCRESRALIDAMLPGVRV